MSDWDDDWENPIFDDDSFDDRSFRDSKRGVFLGIAACAFFIGLLVFGFVSTMLEENQGDVENRALTRAAIREAFDAENVGVGDDLLNELERFFDRLLEASRTRNEHALKQMIDGERFLERIENCGIISSMTYLEERNLKADALDETFEKGWSTHTIIHVDPLGDSSEYLVYAHLTDEEGSARENFRCWVVRTDRGWKLFDWEMIDFGMPESVEEALLFEHSLDGRTDEFIDCTQEIDKAYKLYDQGDHAGAAETLRNAERRNVHPEFNDDAALRIAYAWSYLGDWRECLDATRRIASPDDVPGAYSMQTLVYDEWGHYEKAAETARLHELAAGLDPFVLEARCHALDQLSRLEEAVPSLRKWLRWDVENVEAMQYLGRALPVDQKRLLIEHLDRVTDPVETAVSLAGHFAPNDEPDMIRHLIRFVEQAAPESPRVDYLNGLAERTEGDFERAAEFFLEAVRGEPDEELRNTCFWEYIALMGVLGKFVEAYESLGDRKEAFQALADWIDLDEDDSPAARKNLRNLIEAHRKTAPDDPWLHYHSGVLLAAENKFEAADRELLEAARSDDEDLSSMADSRRVYVLLQTGRGEEAYESIGPPDETFRRIAAHYEWREKPQELRQLLEAHKAAFPDDVWLNYYAGVAELLEQNVEQAEQIFEKEHESSQDETVQRLCRSKLLNLKFESQGAVNAYRDLNFSEDAFQSYANRLFRDEKWDELTDLIKLHEQHHPDDLNLLSWKVSELWRKEDYAAIVRGFSGSLRIEEGAARPWQFEEIENRVFRSLLRTNRFPEAIALAESRFREDGDSEKLLTAHLAAGNLDEARETFELYEQSAYSLGPIYNDEDVGERLSGKEYRALREQFPPPRPYRPLTEVAVLFLDEPPAFDSSRIRELVAPLFGDAVEIIPLDGERGRSVFLIQAEDFALVLTEGPSNYSDPEEAPGDADDLKDPQLQRALRDHRAWIALEIVTGRRIEATDDELGVGYKLVAELLDDHCLGLYLRKKERIVPNSSDVKQALLSDSPDRPLRELGESVWLYRAQPFDPVESLATRQCQARLHRFARAFASRTPEQEFAAQIEFRANHVTEFHWISVESIKKQAYGRYRMTGRFQSDSRLFPGVTAGAPVSIDKYEVFDWKYESDQSVIRGREAPSD